MCHFMKNKAWSSNMNSVPNSLNTNQFKTLHDDVVKNACSLLKSRGEHKHTAIIGKGIDFHLLALKEMVDGKSIHQVVKPACQSLGAEYIFIISESWMAPDSRVPASQHPEREEILLITAEHKNHGQLLSQFKIERNTKGKIRALSRCNQNVTSFTGRLSNLLMNEEGTGDLLEIRKHPGYKKYFKSPGYIVH